MGKVINFQKYRRKRLRRPSTPNVELKVLAALILWTIFAIGVLFVMTLIGPST